MPWRPGSVTSAPDPTRKAYSARSNPWLYIYCIGPSLVPVLVAVFMLYAYCLHSTRMKFVPYSRGIGYLWPQTEELVWSIVTGKSTFITLHYIALQVQSTTTAICLCYAVAAKANQMPCSQSSNVGTNSCSTYHGCHCVHCRPHFAQVQSIHLLSPRRSWCLRCGRCRSFCCPLYHTANNITL